MEFRPTLGAIRQDERALHDLAVPSPRVAVAAKSLARSLSFAKENLAFSFALSLSLCEATGAPDRLAGVPAPPALSSAIGPERLLLSAQVLQASEVLVV